MTNKEFTRQMAQRTGLSSIEISELQTALVDMIVDTCRQGDVVQLSGFGTFEQKERAERRMYNPTTKGFTIVPARQTLSFRPANTLKEKLSQTSPTTAV